MDIGLLITSIANGVFSLISSFLLNKKSTTSEAKINMMEDMLTDQQMQLNKLRELVKISNIGHQFRPDLQNIISENSEIEINRIDTILKVHEKALLKQNKHIDLIFKRDIVISSLTQYFEDLSKFALAFFYSSLRDNEKCTQAKFLEYLNKKHNSIFLPLLTSLADGVKIEKGYITGTSLNRITFTEFLVIKQLDEKDAGIFNLIELLITRLELNNIKEKEMKEIFVKYVDQFMTKFSAKLTDFLDLNDYEFELEKKGII